MIERVRARLFSSLIRRDFDRFGLRSIVRSPFYCIDGRGISIGDDVYLGPGTRLFLPTAGAGSIKIGDRCNVTGRLTISSVVSVILGDDVLLADGVYIADHSHGQAALELPILAQGTENHAPVTIGNGAWLGQNVVIMPGVDIGAGAIVGANAVVRESVPALAVAVGVPARVVRNRAAD